MFSYDTKENSAMNAFFKIYYSDDFGLFADINKTLSPDDIDFISKCCGDIDLVVMHFCNKYLPEKVEDHDDRQEILDFIENDLFSQYERTEYITPESESGNPSEFVLRFYKTSSDDILASIVFGFEIQTDDECLLKQFMSYHQPSQKEREYEEIWSEYEEALWDFD